MAGAKLEFDNGCLGIERCVDPTDGKQYLRACIQSYSTGRTTTAPVEIRDVMAFATEVAKQALLADGHDEREIGELVWRSTPTPVS